MIRSQEQGFEMPNQNVFEQQMEDMKEEMREIRSSMSQIANAMTKLAVLEEKNHTFAATLEKVTSKVERMEERQRDETALRETLIRMDLRVSAIETKADHTELEQIKFQATTEGISKAIKVMWAALGAGIIYIGGKAILFFAAASQTG